MSGGAFAESGAVSKTLLLIAEKLQGVQVKYFHHGAYKILTDEICRYSGELIRLSNEESTYDHNSSIDDKHVEKAIQRLKPYIDRKRDHLITHILGGFGGVFLGVACSLYAEKILENQGKIEGRIDPVYAAALALVGIVGAVLMIWSYSRD